MAENADDAAAAARLAEQARKRREIKEKREARIRADGASRLDKISGLGGGLQRGAPQTTTPKAPTPASTTTPAAATPTAQPTARPLQHADPDEVDISQHFYQPQTAPRIPPQFPQPPGPGPNMSEAGLRQLMLGLDPAAAAAAGLGPNPFGAFPSPGDPEAEDPMMRMMMQMLGGGDGSAGGSGPFPFPSPGGAPGANPFANMPLGMGMPPFGPGGPQQQQQLARPDRYASLWRLLHTAVALGLGLYIALWTSFGGTKVEREREKVVGVVGVEGEEEMRESGKKFFYAFATAEALLLTSRYFMDRGRARSASGGGILGMVVGFLPQPFRGYIEIAMRYGQIFGTVKADVLVCIFVLGVATWARG
ncbi:hypothetical protein B0T25DRAFT_314053 [Lasiosphaeria hispida]|uniref:GET complex subunit GET2 n=1 Tax=Lasiosphaeria hispida TaxID=260671 RepID=A0AAJ0M9G9_9PEZI|nr:hypothetical protein B0T25DRAFT_314053 [Lasiosphaeria hispida]